MGRGADTNERIDSESTYRIGEVARDVGLSFRTIRHYDEVGLVSPSGRTEGGFRVYTAKEIARLRVIKTMKPLDFTLDEMRQLFDARDRLVDDPALDPGERADLESLVAMFAAVVRQRCERLRDQLAAADELAVFLSEASKHDPR